MVENKRVPPFPIEGPALDGGNVKSKTKANPVILAILVPFVAILYIVGQAILVFAILGIICVGPEGFFRSIFGG